MKKINLINSKIQKLKNDIQSIDYILIGSISKKYLKCGKKQCICHKDPTKLHGPYYHFTKKDKGKTIGKLYSKQKADFLKTYLQNYNHVIKIIKKISNLSEQAIALLLKQMKAK